MPISCDRTTSPVGRRKRFAAVAVPESSFSVMSNAPMFQSILMSPSTSLEPGTRPWTSRAASAVIEPTVFVGNSVGFQFAGEDASEIAAVP